MTLNETMLCVCGEVVQARSLHKGFNSPHEGYAVIKEELDELWDEIKKWKYCSGTIDTMRKEAVQVAAMAIQLASQCSDKGWEKS